MASEQIIKKIARETGLTKVGIDIIETELKTKFKLVPWAMDEKIAMRGKKKFNKSWIYWPKSRHTHFQTFYLAERRFTLPFIPN